LTFLLLHLLLSRLPLIHFLVKVFLRLLDLHDFCHEF
jgi:hypothetical protein